MKRHAFEGDIVVIEAEIDSQMMGWHGGIMLGYELNVFEDGVFQMSDTIYILQDLSSDKIRKKLDDRIQVLVEDRPWETKTNPFFRMFDNNGAEPV